MKNAHGRTCKKTKVYIYLYISLYENLFENGCIYIYTPVFKKVYIYIPFVRTTNFVVMRARNVFARREILSLGRRQSKFHISRP